MSPRPYDLGRRQEQIDDNRRRVLQAARDLLGEATSSIAFTVDAVAKRADVARATVYYQFGSRAGVLEALCDALAEAGQLTRLPDIFSDKDARRALHRFIVTFAEFWASDRVVMRRLRALAALDKDVAAVIQARDERHQAGLAVLLNRLDGTAATAKSVQLLHTLTSFETYDSLAGPTEDPVQVAALLIQLAEAVLSLPPPAGSPRQTPRASRPKQGRIGRQPS
jgi:AcrR family transcriptional regulator